MCLLTQKRRVFLPPYLFISSPHLLRVLIAKLDFQLNLAPGKHDILPFQRYSYIVFFTTGDRVGKKRSCSCKRDEEYLLFSKMVIISLFRAGFFFFCCCCTGHSEEAFLSGAASKHFFFPRQQSYRFFCGMSYLSEGLETDLFRSVLLKRTRA